MNAHKLGTEPTLWEKTPYEEARDELLRFIREEMEIDDYEWEQSEMGKTW